MGMTLIPENHSAKDLDYNWSGWSALVNFVSNYGVSTKEFDGLNDGRFIRSVTCKLVAFVIRNHAEEYNQIYGGAEKPDGYGRYPALEHADIWHNSNGFYQR